MIEAVAQAEKKPLVVLQSSAVGYYGFHGDEVLTEEAKPGDDWGGRFTAEIWEPSTAAVEQMGVRRVVVRSGVVLSTQDGALPRLLLPFRFFAGGPQSVRGFGWNLLGPTVLVLDAIEDCEEGVDLQDCADLVAATDPNRFVQRPVGGNSVAEVSLELRQDLGRSWRLVGFLDVGQVFASLTELDPPIFTPGIGIRYVTPVGPFRLDIGYNPTSATLLPVVATLENGDIVELEDRVLYDPFTYDNPSLLTQFWRRLRFHFSIGEAF